ncbi:MAG: ATP-binding protein, partial [Hyphomicrobiaceae bacterium]|nr:ATP-binding protein [Hyphomicrobiaceae bacterium]
EAALGILERAEGRQGEAPVASHPGRTRFISPIAGAPSRVSRSRAAFREALAARSPEDGLLSPRQHEIFYKARRAVAVGLTVSEFVVEPLGYLDLGEKKRSGALSGKEETRFRELVRARALIACFTAAAHLLHTLGAAPAGEAADPGALPVETAHDALEVFIAHLAEAARAAADDEDLAPRIAQAANDVIARVESDAHRLMAPDLPAFAGTTYAVETDDFHVRGFERSAATKAKKPLVMAFKKPNEVVGNHIAKSQALRLARMLAAYDAERRMNPFVELGGFLFTVIGDGFPGTGKTTLIQMTAGLVKDYAELAGLAFTYENFGIDQISEYQGKSGQNAKAFIERVLDPSGIGFGTIDDVDQVAGRRDDRQSSSGQQEVTAVLMEAFSGAGTVVRGNASFAMFSNYPEKVDDALRQRAGGRWLVDGPQTEADYIDLFHLLLGKNHEIPLGDHDLYAAQELKSAVAKSYEGHSEPQEDGLKAVYERIIGVAGQPATLADVGRYLHAIRVVEPRFTGRAIKNVTDAIKMRALDVDLPDVWFETPDAFLRKSYDDKLAMVRALQKPITLPMIVQEINRYADSEFRYSDTSDEAAINGMIRDHRLRSEAARRIGEGEG